MYSRVADLRQRLEALASKLSELEEIRQKVAQAEDEARTKQAGSQLDERSAESGGTKTGIRDIRGTGDCLPTSRQRTSRLWFECDHG